MKTILDVLNLSTQYLAQRGISHAKRQAQELLSLALELKPMDLYLHFDKPLTEGELEKCRQWLARRAKHEPAAYIKGDVDFLDCRIAVTGDVLIPRPETEILADKIATELSQQELAGKVLWDVCAGSGCIGIALKRRCPALRVVLSDISAKALLVAEGNARRNQVDVEILEGDLLAPFVDRQADFIVCNPPYIAEAEYETLDADVRDYEPRGALVGGRSGLEYYERLAAELPAYLRRPAKVWLELGGTQGEAVLGVFGSTVWKTRRLEKDWAGWDRFFFLEIE